MFRSFGAVVLALVTADSLAGGQKAPATPLDLILDRTAGFVDDYAESLNGVQLEERCDAEVEQMRRSEKADLVFASTGSGSILAIRDVFEVDGTPIRPRSNRVMALLVEGKPGALMAAQFLPPLPKFSCWLDTRRLSFPTGPLRFLMRGYQSRSKFGVDRVEMVNGTEVATIRFAETATPSLAHAYQDLVPDEAVTFGMFNQPRKDSTSASGRFWVETKTGRLRQAELRVRTGIHNGPLESTDGETSVHLTVRYDIDPATGFWLPQTMDMTNEATVRPIVAVSDAPSANYVGRRERFQMRYSNPTKTAVDVRKLFHAERR